MMSLTSWTCWSWARPWWGSQVGEVVGWRLVGGATARQVPGKQGMTRQHQPWPPSRLKDGTIAEGAMQLSLPLDRCCWRCRSCRPIWAVHGAAQAPDHCCGAGGQPGRCVCG
jgi:hypothetical protein